MLRGLSLAGADSELSSSLGNLGHLKSWYGGRPYHYCNYNFEGQAACLGGRQWGSTTGQDGQLREDNVEGPNILWGSKAAFLGWLRVSQPLQ